MTQMDVPPGANDVEQKEKEKKREALQYAKKTLASIAEQGVNGDDYDRSMAAISNSAYYLKIIRPDLCERIYREIVPTAGIVFISQAIEKLNDETSEYPLAKYQSIVWHEGRKVSSNAGDISIPMSDVFRKAILKFIARDAQIFPDPRYASIYLKFIGENEAADNMEQAIREQMRNYRLESSEQEVREQIEHIEQIRAAYAEFMQDIEPLEENKIDIRQVCSEILREVETELANLS